MLTEVGLLALRGLAGGTLVLLFSLIGEVTTPKTFSGLFSAAPSVAIASLALTVLSEGTAKARQDTVGMVVGGVGMIACCVVAATAIPKVRAVWGSVVAWGAWVVVALGLYAAVFIGA